MVSRRPLLCFVLLSSACLAQVPGAIETKTATTHPMIYLLSLPKAWKKGKTWPVVVAIEDADRDFPREMMAFEKARGDLPFILVVPEVLTNGGPNYVRSVNYGYSEKIWTKILQEDPWTFDQQGIAAVIDDVHRLYGGDTKYFLTGWEAGGHTAFALAFNHPENLRAAAVCCPNYAGRNVQFSTWKDRSKVPITIFYGTKDEGMKDGQPLAIQTERAISEAHKHGFDITMKTIPDAGHDPLAPSVLQWFASLLVG